MASLSKRQTRRVIHTIAQALPWVAYLEGRLPPGKTAHVRDWYRHQTWLRHQAQPLHWADVVFEAGTDRIVSVTEDEPLFTLRRCPCRICEKAAWKRIRRFKRCL